MFSDRTTITPERLIAAVAAEYGGRTVAAAAEVRQGEPFIKVELADRVTKFFLVFEDVRRQLECLPVLSVRLIAAGIRGAAAVAARGPCVDERPELN